MRESSVAMWPSSVKLTLTWVIGINFLVTVILTYLAVTDWTLMSSARCEKDFVVQLSMDDGVYYRDFTCTPASWRGIPPVKRLSGRPEKILRGKAP